MSDLIKAQNQMISHTNAARQAMLSEPFGYMNRDNRVIVDDAFKVHDSVAMYEGHVVVVLRQEVMRLNALVERLGIEHSLHSRSYKDTGDVRRLLQEGQCNHHRSSGSIIDPRTIAVALVGNDDQQKDARAILARQVGDIDYPFLADILEYPQQG